MNEVSFAYLAGMIDADGYITIMRTRKSNRGRCEPAIYHSLQVGIAGTDRLPHDFAASIFGGNVATYKPKNPRHRSQFQWSASGPTAAKVIRSIQPYLLIKKHQAEVGLRFQSLLETHVASRQGAIPPYRISAEQRQERDEICKEMRSLNKPRRIFSTS